MHASTPGTDTVHAERVGTSEYLRILKKSFESCNAAEVWIVSFLSMVPTSDGSSPVQMFEVAVKHDVLRGSVRILQEPGSSALRVSLDIQIDSAWLCLGSL